MKITTVFTYSYTNHCTKEQVLLLFPVFAKMVVVNNTIEWIVPSWLQLLWNHSQEHSST